jgi:hypothetical protein
MEWDGCHSLDSRSIFQVDQNGPTKTIATTFDLAKSFFDMWVRHHGMPQFIISDRNAKFIVGFYKHLV